MARNAIISKTKIEKPKTDNMKWLPLILIESYLILTLLIYQFGLFKWDTQNTFKFWIYIILYHIAFIAGYIWIARKSANCENIYANNIIKKINPIFGALLLLYVIYVVILYKNTTGYDYSNITSLFSEVAKALENPGKQYYEANERLKTYGGQKIITAVSGIFSVFFYSLIPLATYWWDRLSKVYKALFYAIILLNVSVNVSVGKNSGIFIMLFYFMSSFLLVVVIKGKEQIKTRKSFIFFIGLLCIFSFWFFSRGMETRIGSVVTDANIRNEIQLAEIQANQAQTDKTQSNQNVPSKETERSDIAKIAPEKRYTNLNMPLSAENLFYGVDNYLTNGYFMFSLALSEPVEWCYGLGSSDFLRSNARSVLGINVSSKMLESKLTEKYSGLNYFSSIYTSLANDLHFVGIIVFMLLAGMLTAYIWRDAYFNKNTVAYLLLPLLAIFYLYFPVGNILGNNITMFFAFFELLFLYIGAKYLIKKRIREEDRND